MTATIVGKRAYVPRGFDLTGNRVDARLVSGRGIDLDGTGDFISMGHPSDLDGFFNTGGTISMWINMTSTANFERLFDFGTGTYIYLQGGFNGYIFNKDFSTTDGNWTFNGNGGVSLGEWFHFCLSYDASSTSNNPDLYINGVLQTIDGTTTPAGSAAAETSEKRIGSDASGGSNLDASLAHIKFITSTVTAAQALEMCNNPEQVLPTGIATSALKSWLPCSDFDIAPSDNSLDGMFAQDASDNENHGALTNCGMVLAQPPPCPQLGLQSSSSLIYLAGASSGDYLQSSDTSLSTATFTFSAWVCAFDSAGNYPSIISAHDGSSNDYQNGITIDFGSSSQTAVEYINIEGVGVSSATDLWSGSIAFGQWFHIVVTSTTSEYKLYINGSDTNCNTRSRSDTSANDLNIVRIGARYYSSGLQAATQFDGLITDVGLWNAALDADSVAAIHSAGKGADIRSDIGNYDQSSALQHLWRTDNPVTCSDLEGSDDMTVYGAPNMATVPEGSTAGLSVFGNLTQKANQHVFSGMPLTPGAVANGGALKFEPFQFGTDDFTIHFWYKISHAHWGGNSNARLFHSAGSAGYINLLAYQTGTYWCFIQGASGSINANSLQPGTHNVAGDWVQVCVRREAAALFTFHSRTLGGTVGLDSNEDQTTDVGAINLDSPFGLRFGAGHNDTNPYNNASGASFCGVRIYKGTAITDAQVNQLFEADARILRSL